MIRMKYHLAGTHGDIGPCSQVTDDIENFFINYLGKRKKNDIVGVECFQNDERGIKVREPWMTT